MELFYNNVSVVINYIYRKEMAFQERKDKLSSETIRADIY